MNEFKIDDLKKYADIAYYILNEKDTPLKRKKEIIKQFFDNDFNLSEEDLIFTRLSLIDSFYSTNMSKRRFGIEDLSNQIIKFTDSELKNIAKKRDFNNQILQELISGKYGFNDKQIKQNSNHYATTNIDVKEGSKAVSLITKYLYFLTDYQFPIYDSFVEVFLSNHFDVSKYRLRKDVTCFFRLISELNKNYEINNFEKLDNFLWLLGKIKEESFSLILDEKEYKSYLNNNKKIQRTCSKLEKLDNFISFVDNYNSLK